MPRTANAPTGRRRARLAIAACGAAAALVAGALAPATAANPAPHAAPKPRAEHYVALGDSFTAGSLIPVQIDAACGRSNRNYPSLTARWLSPAEFRDVSCGGAKTDDMWRPQPGTGKPEQFAALKADTTLVSIGIGGNDIGFGEVVRACTYAIPKPIPDGNPCEQRYTKGGIDQLAERILETAPKVAAVLAEIRKRSHNAHVIVVGFPAILSENAADAEGCKASLRMPVGDIPYLRDTMRSLNTMLRHEAQRARATYVDTYTPSVDHNACRPFAERWVEGMYPRAERPAWPFHPNANGEAGMAEAVKRTLAAPKV
ncbi:SGNH/GDSL hydrolase family protein [Streptomyces griseocarneus]|uniref:SGNH/GDSL hydrolase family protein n=1 Tax=Streptomyces griseocarneus TaxID=51201 RepID=UPI00167E5610|nr:SGNH/GDSL hydrolase family protein [Streptomyces griseocarneus]MBZ6473957.1 SGNH/GDSL hydrolase family protein [Streptomyces griseocarneus]GHG66106.1 lipase [Streptomyces griseocarneus]